MNLVILHHDSQQQVSDFISGTRIQLYLPVPSDTQALLRSCVDLLDHYSFIANHGLVISFDMSFRDNETSLRFPLEGNPLPDYSTESSTIRRLQILRS